MVTIDQEKCVRCGQCLAICPEKLFDREGDDGPVSGARPEVCIRCLHCMACCPTEAVQVEGHEYGGFGALPDEPRSPEALEKLLLVRRAVRQYRPEPVPREVLERLLALAATAPMGIPPTTVEVTVVTDPEKLRAIGPAVLEQMKHMRQGLQMPIMGALLRRSIGKDLVAALEEFLFPVLDQAEAGFRERGEDMVTWSAPAVLVFHSRPHALAPQEDCQIAATYAMLAAESLGLGSCMNGLICGTVDHDPKMKADLGIPPDHKVPAALLVGYPARRPFKRTIPRDFKAVHWV